MAIKAKTALVALILGVTLAPNVSFAVAHRETERDIAPGTNEGPGTPGGLPNPGGSGDDGQSPPMNVPSDSSASGQQGTSSMPPSAPSTNAGSSGWWQGPSSDDAVTGAHRRTAE
jgi:hypothetical protein